MNHDCERVQRAWLDGLRLRSEQSAHLDVCPDCRSFAAVERFLAEPDPPGVGNNVSHGLISETLLRLAPLMERRARERRRLSLRLAAAGIASLPPIALLNATIAWALYSTLERLASPEAALAGVSVYAASALLSLAIAYGSLPLMASWGLRLREEAA